MSCISGNTPGMILKTVSDNISTIIILEFYKFRPKTNSGNNSRSPLNYEIYTVNKIKGFLKPVVVVLVDVGVALLFLRRKERLGEIQ